MANKRCFSSIAQLLVLAIVSWLTGCIDDIMVDEIPGDDVDDIGKIVMHQTGGFAGVSKIITIEARDGSVILSYMDQGTNQHRESRVSSEDVTRLWETLEATGKGRWWNAFLVRLGNKDPGTESDRFFICNEQGELILARLTPKGYTEFGRVFLIEPTGSEKGRKLVWSHPAFAYRAVFARNHGEIVCADLEGE